MNPDLKDPNFENERKNSLLTKDLSVPSHTHSLKRPAKKVLLLGFNNVGKSALAIKFVHDYFQDNNFNSSIEENYRKTIKFLKVLIKIKDFGNFLKCI